MKYVAYFRVSTQKQGQSGLGLDAQRAAVGPYPVIAEYIEVESGRKHTNRPQLAKALAHCRAARATLIIAKLDRLSRNAAFLTTLMESGVDLVCADMPEANRLTLQMMAVIAEHESRMISERTKAAIAARKARGKPWTHARPPAGTAKRAAYARKHIAKQAASRKADLLPVVREIASTGASLRDIAKELAARGFRGARGGKITASYVMSVLGN